MWGDFIPIHWISLPTRFHYYWLDSKFLPSFLFVLSSTIPPNRDHLRLPMEQGLYHAQQSMHSSKAEMDSTKYEPWKQKAFISICERWEEITYMNSDDQQNRQTDLRTHFWLGFVIVYAHQTILVIEMNGNFLRLRIKYDAIIRDSAWMRRPQNFNRSINSVDLLCWIQKAIEQLQIIAIWMGRRWLLYSWKLHTHTHMHTHQCVCNVMTLCSANTSQSEIERMSPEWGKQCWNSTNSEVNENNRKWHWSLVHKIFVDSTKVRLNERHLHNQIHIMLTSQFFEILISVITVKMAASNQRLRALRSIW